MEEDERLLWKSEAAESMMSVTLGRAMSALLSARPRKLHDAFSRLSSDPRARPSLGSLEESLWFLHKYVRDAAEKEESLDDILIPMLQNSLRYKDVKHSHGCQSMLLLNWLFQDEFIFQAIAANLAKIIGTKDDRFIALGWCTLVRGLVECENAMIQYPLHGIRQRYMDLLKILSSCISHLSRIVCNGSTLQDGFELPSRLAVSAADCFIVLTESLTKKAVAPSNRQKSSDSTASIQRTAVLPNIGSDKKNKPLEVTNSEMENVVWDHLEELIHLMQKLLAWSRKSRPLHAQGLEKVLKWLQEMKRECEKLQVETGPRIIKTRILLLSSCWKHYSMLVCLEDHKGSLHYKQLLEQYLSGLQFYSDNHTGVNSENNDGGMETRKFFLHCLSLLLGRLDSKKFESMMSEYGMQITKVLLLQLHCVDEDVVSGVVCILKAVIFKPHYSSGRSLPDSGQVDAVLPLLLNFLDERDGTARAVVMLIAEYCSMSMDTRCLQEVLKRLTSGIFQQRKNAIDVVSELIRISSDSAIVLSVPSWQDIANHLLECLKDKEIGISEQASNLLPMIDPSLVLPTLVGLVLSSNERVQLSYSGALVAVLKYHSQDAEVICILLDCLRNISQSLDLQKTKGEVGEGPKMEIDQVLKLIPEWSKSVQNWKFLIGPLIDKMFAEPSNAIIVRFLSCISKHLAEAVDVVLSHILLHSKGQKDIDESSFARWKSGSYTSDDSAKMQQLLFEHLCPLLITRMLPLSIFNDLNSLVMYDQLSNQSIINDYGDINIFNHDCLAALLLKRAFYNFEFEDVRKLAAELCGRIHPQVLIPIVCSVLEDSTASQDILKIKTCLFSVCTSLTIRGRDSLSHPVMFKIRKTMEKILLWPSLDGDEVSKAQHGCIDCLALMICAELQGPESFKDSYTEKIADVGKKVDSGDAPARNNVLSYVISQLTCDSHETVSTSHLGCGISTLTVPVPLPFRLCMANVLISACQKISDSGKNRFARSALPSLIHSLEMIVQSEIRAACIQVLFSAVYHLKSDVLPYSSKLLKLSMKALREGSERERLAGARLMASLMASEDDEILESISAGLAEANSVLSSICTTDPSQELRQICQKLLSCVTYPWSVPQI
ncbi:hypothetical protein FNV43_RR16487 [Rhamnella rubrinervis]|uniref:ARM repeat superfamily protein n=1 Tax=Rhamnella rubrinervis TaxID=2594499 RepID=A0A8K0GYX4_9ROSA|nr:hypothetical protein FNV43_RR16487 [Rhamnella rubrinervis]